MPSASDPLPATNLVARVTAVPAMLRAITEITGLRLSLIAEVTDDRWLCCAVNDQMGFGLKPGGELDLDTTLCKEVRRTRTPILISHASADPTYCAHPTAQLYNIESYISVPIYLRNQRYFGNLCALDSRPTDVSPKVLRLFEAMAELVGAQIEVEAHHAITSRALLDEQETAEMRELFIAVLGHDLRTPLSAIVTGLQVLSMTAKEELVQQTIGRISRSTTRMTRLIDDLLDFARGRLGGGIPLELAPFTDLAIVIKNVVEEVRAGNAAQIVVTGEPPHTMRADRSRIAQALTNLLANAVQHGAPGQPITVSTAATEHTLTLAVTSIGTIPPEQRARIFEPYQRGTDGPSSGLGLGLFIVSEIARAHGGVVDCASNAGTTTFSMTLPRTPR